MRWPPRAAMFMAAAPSRSGKALRAKGIRRVDARAGVVTLELDRRAVDSVTGGCAILRMVVRHMTPAVRPDDVLAALRQVAGLAPLSPPLVTRLAQGPLGAAAGGLSEPGAATAQPLTATPPTAVPRLVVRRPRLDGPVTIDEAKRRRCRQSGVAPDRRAQTICSCAAQWFPQRKPLAPGSLTGDCPHARNRA